MTLDWDKFVARLLAAASLQQVMLAVGLWLLSRGAQAFVPLYQAQQLALPLPTKALLSADTWLLASPLAAALFFLALRARRAWIAGLWLTLIGQMLLTLSLGWLASAAALPLAQLLTQ